MSDQRGRHTRRRRFLATVGAATLPILAGCSGSESDDSSDGGDGGGSGDSSQSGSNGSESDSASNDSESGSESGNDSENNSGGEGGSDPASAAQGEDVLENAGLLIQEHELVEEDEFNTYVEGVVENTTDEEKSYVEVRVRAYDADGNQIDSYLDNTQNLQGGGTWAFEVMILDPEDLEEYDIAVSDSSLS